MILHCNTLQSAGLQKIDVEPYRNVELECQGPENGKLILLAWKRPDLLSDGYVFFYRDDLPHKNFQDPIFKDRVKLRDPQMKNMDMSIILSNITINDTGTYECCIVVEDTGDSRQETSEIKHEIRLKVRLLGQTERFGDGGKKEEAGFSVGQNGLLISLGFSVVGLIVLVITLLMPKKQEHHPSSS
ncbi:uncharacterized protein LOC120437403 isoform X2 [Oreochromis aureus]|uniref:uncharacterized protein LOC120437403 isoform X2 n=1 Tax=Oreochromis aureus TaxID=47969 RepID=UPI0019542D47|nr:uncharacterized protein LOC120437403 isoform X2 [Oreochromis aureus]CAI5660279.1 unnamed protein product [Mustela putorius furo]